MGEQQAGQERLLKQLIGSFRCHVCRRSFEREHVRVTARHEQLWIVSVRCTQCRNQQVFWVALKDNEEDSARSEITAEEAEQFALAGPVSGDDVLHMHEFLSTFGGDFADLFGG